MEEENFEVTTNDEVIEESITNDATITEEDIDSQADNDNLLKEIDSLKENNAMEASTNEELVNQIFRLEKQINSLKEENSKTKSNLMWKVRKLEKDKVLVENEKIRFERELKSLRSEVERFRSPPLVLATITEILDESRMTVKSSTGPSFLVNYSKFLDKKLLVPGSRVALNQQTFGIVELLPSEKDANVSGMEIEEKSNVTYDTIGGLEEQIVEVKETVELPLKEPELFEKIGIDPPKGILLYGPPGTGKTLLAKAAANETNATFIKVVASEFVKKYGQIKRCDDSA